MDHWFDVTLVWKCIRCIHYTIRCDNFSTPIRKFQIFLPVNSFWKLLTTLSYDNQIYFEIGFLCKFSFSFWKYEFFIILQMRLFLSQLCVSVWLAGRQARWMVSYFFLWISICLYFVRKKKPSVKLILVTVAKLNFEKKQHCRLKLLSSW